MSKFGRKELLTTLSAIFGVGGFVVNILMNKDETEEIAKRAAELVAEKSEETK